MPMYRVPGQYASDPVPRRAPGKGMVGVPAQWTTDPNVLPSPDVLKTLAAASGSAASGRFASIAGATADAAGIPREESDEYKLLREIDEHLSQSRSEQARMEVLFRRLDNLYFPETLTDPGGADHWPEGNRPGRTHISINNYPVYVDIPASLQAVVPVENYVAPTSEDDERAAAGRVERLYFQWKDEDEFELKVHKACVIKALYGHTFGKVYWDEDEKRPTVTIIQAPERLSVGWGSSDYDRIDWAVYCYGLSDAAIEQDYPDLKVGAYSDGGSKAYPIVMQGDHADPIYTINPAYDRRRNKPDAELVEVYDYWYKAPGTKKKPKVYNAIFVGNKMVKNKHHPEYDDIPYIPLPNTFIPGTPYGRPELYDIEQIIREKDERLSEGAQMLHSTIAGQMWQLVGPDAPDDVPPNAVPKPNKVAAPGPGNRLEPITPFVPQFAVEDYMKRLDAELEVITGLNDLLVGRAPSAILGSSKAITALVAQYEARIRMKRDILYQWRKRMWRVAAKVWERKSSEVKEIIGGRYRLDVKPPELTPRDELEIAQMAVNLVNARLWSMERAMDRTGVEDPSDEKVLVRAEQTDPTLNPAAVQAQATLLSAMQALGATGQQGPTPEQSANATRQANRTPQGTPSLNGPENEGQTPPGSMPENATGILAQTMVQKGNASGRLLTQTQIPPEAG